MSITPVITSILHADNELRLVVHVTENCLCLNPLCVCACACVTKDHVEKAIAQYPPVELE